MTSLQLSVITVHLDDFDGLSETLRSLTEGLRSKRLEWIVIDGCSRPATPAQGWLLETVATSASTYVSETDQGIYDAMNKGTRHATGDYVLYLNAGDELHPKFNLEKLASELGNESPAMIWGVCHERYPNGELVRVKNRSPALAWYGMPVNHQNVLFRRALLGDAPYDLQYKICADYDLISRILKQGGKVYRTLLPFAIFQRGGANEQKLGVTMTEEARIRTVYYGVPSAISQGIKLLKGFTAQLGRVPALRRLMRKWV